ncbi:hypothetical protein ACFQI7_28180 [Paenibacillus allorhizosphaerae]|uniref:Uncharacterized protein n=1 Tax=Paenibacillus allorhizosphaerae TaxID=2849866 RepID=A0ABM8VNG2_9BACL|nr:hypothetical protein [Paenibacillus allorhizosphaerae]CAG7651473.1 hypothetical protein PAECIP111802_04973 [Paenibacillus allorhizosphaerae]
MEFQDELRFTAKQKGKIYKKFMKVVKARDSMMIDKSLYEFLHVYSGFIAHYNLHGFRDYYRHLKGIIEMLEELLLHHFEWGAGSYTDIGNALKEIAREALPGIRIEEEAKIKQRELATLQALAAKHGYRVGLEEDAPCAVQPELQTMEVPSIQAKKRKREAFCEGQLLLKL